jgi:RimJ/RimL family protein N-acetyltransferase
VYHRVAIAEEYLGKGFAKVMIESIHQYAKEKGIKSVKADTNFDNQAMLKLFEKLGYLYCGEVYFRGSARRAYEKVLTQIS